jgi:uncharacterized membrane protein YbhN (UPF0104 family)
MCVVGDLSSSMDGFFRAVEEFAQNLASLAWGPLVIALALWAAMLLVRAHAWANGLRAAYPDDAVRERGVVAAFLVGAGLNGILPAKGGDLLKVFLAKQSIPGSSYAAVLSSYVVLGPFDTTIGILVLIFAITQGLLPELPQLPSLPAFEVSFWADNPQLLILTLTVLGIATIVGFAYAARRVNALWAHLKQGLAIFRTPRAYLSRVVAWQAVGWLCRFGSYWFFLEAFQIGGTVENVMLAMAVESVSKALPLTPGGAGAQQALLVATLAGPSRAAVLSFSVGQQIAVTALAATLGFVALLVVFRTRDWRGLMRRAELETATAEPAP